MSSELKKKYKNPEFHARLMEIIGDEKPYRWAGKVGISKGAFDRILNEGTLPSSRSLARINEATKVSVNWLLTGKGLKYDAGLETNLAVQESTGEYKVKPPIQDLKSLLSAVEQIMTSKDETAKAALAMNVAALQVTAQIVMDPDLRKLCKMYLEVDEHHRLEMIDYVTTVYKVYNIRKETKEEGEEIKKAVPE